MAKRNDIVIWFVIPLTTLTTTLQAGYLGLGSSVYLQLEKSFAQNFGAPIYQLNEIDYRISIPNTKDLLYLDPPYYLEQDKDMKMFNGIYPMRNIPVHHDGFDYEKLRDMLYKLKVVLFCHIIIVKPLGMV